MNKCPHFKRKIKSVSYGWGIRCYKYCNGEVSFFPDERSDLSSRDEYIRKYCNGKYEKCSYYKILS